jgi:hypothetical protein
VYVGALCLLLSFNISIADLFLWNKQTKEKKTMDEWADIDTQSVDSLKRSDESKAYMRSELHGFYGLYAMLLEIMANESSVITEAKLLLSPALDSTDSTVLTTALENPANLLNLIEDSVVTNYPYLIQLRCDFLGLVVKIVTKLMSGNTSTMESKVTSVERNMKSALKLSDSAMREITLKLLLPTEVSIYNSLRTLLISSGYSRFKDLAILQQHTSV